MAPLDLDEPLDIVSMACAENRFSQFIQCVGFPVLHLDLTYAIVSVNELASALFQQDDLVGKPLPKACESARIALPALPEPALLVQLPHLDAHRFSADGLRLLRWRFHPEHNEQGELAGLFLLLEDLTDQLARSEAHFQLHAQVTQLMQAFPGYIYWKDQNLVYRGCNDNYAKALGMNHAADLVGLSDDALNWEEVAFEVARDTDQKVLQGDILLDHEEACLRIDGTEAVLSTNKVPLKNASGHIVGVLGVFQDVSVTKQRLQMAQSKDLQSAWERQAKTTFLASMSHDLKTPLHAVLGMAEILKIKHHLPEQEEQIEGILKGGNTILHLVEDILGYAKLESGKKEFKATTFDLRDLIEGIVGALSHDANENNVKLIISYCETVPRMVNSDATAVRRIVLNLLSNAIKFTEKGHIMISVEMIAVNDDKVNLQIIVEDTGIGIAKENLDQIFERFYRATPSYTGRYRGTGLGLTIAKQLAQDLGGSLKVNSRLGAGSTFWCSLPFDLIEQADTSGVWEQRYPGKRVLIVDDHDIRGFAIRKQIGPDCATVVTAEKAISELVYADKTAHPYSVVIVDDEVIGQDVEALAEAMLKPTVSVPFMLLAFVRPLSFDTAEKLRAAGVFKQFVKPVQPSELTCELLQAYADWQAVMPALPEESQVVALAEPIVLTKSNQEIQAELNTPTQFRALLVEDNFFSQKVSRVMLESLDCQVDIASTAKRALQLASNNYDIIFVDIGLPDGSGLDVAKEITRHKLGNPSVRLCALTAHTNEVDRKNCVAAGVLDFICKPARQEDFQAVLQLVVEARQSAS